MNIEEVRLFCLSQKMVTEDMPWGDDVLLFRVCGKIFVALSLSNEQPHVAVKCDPEQAVFLRDTYQAVEPAYHWNKKYWNDLYLQRDMSDAEIKRWIMHSYDEVCKKLPKSKKSSD